MNLFLLRALMAVALLFSSAAVLAQAPSVESPTDTGPVPQVADEPTDTDIDTDTATPPAEDVPRKLVRDHKFQGFVNMLFGLGLYIVVPYEKNDPEKACGYDNGESLAVCSGRSSMHLDFLGGFGVKSGLEIFLMYRQGVEQEERGRPQVRLLGAGFKAYTPSDGLFKLAFGVVPMFDFSKRTGSLGNDFLIHVPIAAQWDIVRWFGIYLQVAPNFSFVSEFRFDITYGLGVQGRFP